MIQIGPSAVAGGQERPGHSSTLEERSKVFGPSHTDGALVVRELPTPKW